MPGRPTEVWRLVAFRAYTLLLLYFVLLTIAVVHAPDSKAALGKHDRDVIRFFQHHPNLAATPAGGRALARVLPKVVREIDSATPLYPPDHALWVCISGFEASWDSRAGVTDTYEHYGGLQMTWNWMHLINGNAGNYSEAVQEWAAHKAWAENGYSYSFLYGQWYEWDFADGCGTTG